MARTGRRDPPISCSSYSHTTTGQDAQASIKNLIVVLGSMIGLVGFHYPYVTQDEPLRDPQKVLRVEGTNIFLESGAAIALDQIYAAASARHI